jgi:hypothetical protein
MNRLLKTILLWLLIAALPIQGWAAAVKATCGPAHHDSLAAAATPPIHHHDAMSHHHDHDGHTVSEMTSAAGEDFSSAVDESPDTTSKSAYCSACAICSVGAVAPPSMASSPPKLAVSEFIVAHPAILFTGHIPTGLERPPRHFSA